MTKKITDAMKLEMRNKFVHGIVDDNGVRQWPSIDAMVREYGVARATMYRLSEKEGWQRQKNQYQTELTAKEDQERMKRMVSDGKRLDDASIQIAQAMLGRVGRRLQRAAQEEQQTGKEAIDASELRELSSVTMNAQKIGKLALGQAQEISKVAADVSNPEAFHAVLEQLDELAAARSRGDGQAIH